MVIFFFIESKYLKTPVFCKIDKSIDNLLYEDIYPDNISRIDNDYLEVVASFNQKPTYNLIKQNYPELLI